MKSSLQLWMFWRFFAVFACFQTGMNAIEAAEQRAIATIQQLSSQTPALASKTEQSPVTAQSSPKEEPLTTIFDALDMLLKRIDQAVPESTRPKHFRFALKIIADDIKDLKELLNSQNTEIQLLALPVQQLFKQLSELLKSTTTLDDEEAAQFAQKFKEFKNKIEDLPITNEKLKLLISEIPSIFIEDLLDVSLVPSKTLKNRIKSYLSSLEKQIKDGLKYAKTHKKEALYKGYQGLWAIGSAYLTYRMMFINDKERFERYRDVIKEDILTGEQLLTGELKIGDLFKRKDLAGVIPLEKIYGIKSVKEKLQGFIDTAKDQGVKALSSMIIIGPPGVGKTLVVKAFARAVNLPVHSISGNSSDAQNAYWLENFFNKARKDAPCFVVIDEIEKMPENQKDLLLTETEGLTTNPKKPIILIGMANDITKLSDALLTRFPEQIIFKNPELQDCKEILRYSINDKAKEGDLSVDPAINEECINALAQIVDGLGTREIVNIINNSIRKAYQKKSKVLKAEFLQDEAKQFVETKRKLKEERARKEKEKSENPVKANTSKE